VDVKTLAIKIQEISSRAVAEATFSLVSYVVGTSQASAWNANWDDLENWCNVCVKTESTAEYWQGLMTLSSLDVKSFSVLSKICIVFCEGEHSWAEYKTLVRSRK
jgi:hypothetical protein